jgi:hypothetical protein
MNGERTGKYLRQVEHIHGHLWCQHRYSITVNQVVMATVKLWSDDFNLTKRNPWFSSFLVSSNPLIKEILIGTTSSGISYQLRDIYSICRCCWNVATYEWKVHNRKIEIISFVVKYEPHWKPGENSGAPEE